MLLCSFPSYLLTVHKKSKFSRTEAAIIHCAPRMWNWGINSRTQYELVYRMLNLLNQLLEGFNFIETFQDIVYTICCVVPLV